ncbi:cmdD [Symbiodinium sp. CCMP2592]|nr:cmdD [Symbiodinium sp. CCMP2592]
MGRNDFQVKISGVRIECEEVSAVLKTHPVVGDALVTAFDGPFGKALAAYVVTTDTVDWSQEMSQGAQDEDEILNVSSWGAVYDEMYKETDNSVSAQDPTLNWSGYTDTYSRRPHIEPVIKEWVEWSCEQVSAHAGLLREGSWRKGRPTITELGCGNGMLLFRLAPLLGETGRYIGTDISTRALETVAELKRTLPQYQHLNVDTKALAAHEIFEVVQAQENDIVLCNGVTMYFPTANYLLKCMQLSAEATRDGGLVVYGDIQSRRHVLAFRAHVETYQALRRQDATASAVLHAAKQSVAGEELSYFDDALFHRLDRNGHGLFQNRLARVELRVKRGWWHSEFNRFRYDVWLVLGEKEEREPKFEMISYEQVQQELQLGDGDANELVDSRLVEKLEDWVAQRLKAVESAGEMDGFVVTLPNARTFHATRLLEWLETAAAAVEPVELSSLPGLLHPADACSGSVRESAKFGVEPEMLFTLELPEGWEQRVIWAEDPGFLRFVVLKSEASKCSWLAAATAAPREELPEDLSAFKNQPEDVEFSFNPVKACNDLMKAWAAGTSLLPAMRPSVYIPLEAFPKNAAGKIDRAALPDAVKAFEEISTTAAAEYEPPSTEEEKTMVEIWEKVLKVQVGVLTPFVAYGGHSLTAVQLCSSVNAAFNQRPDLVYLMSEDCTVRALLAKLRSEGAQAKPEEGCVVRLSPEGRGGLPMLIFCAAGTSAATYGGVAERASRLQLFGVELPGRGRRAEEPVVSDFKELFEVLREDVMNWARRQKRFFVWGDSLGAVLAYEFAKLWEADPSTSLLGLYASGNAGPSEASRERGMGEAAMVHLGYEGPCREMTQEDWKRFLLASAGTGRAELEQLLQKPDLAESIVNPVRADCLAYESYRLSQVERIHSPIVTLRGGQDVITSPQAMRSWQEVAGSRYEHKEFGSFGHMLARECPSLLAELFEQYSLPDFTHELRHFETFRTAYRLMRTRSQQHGSSQKARDIRKSMRVCSPTLGATKVPLDVELNVAELDLNWELLDDITPPTKEVKVMRVGNLTWRKGEFGSSPPRHKTFSRFSQREFAQFGQVLGDLVEYVLEQDGKVSSEKFQGFYSKHPAHKAAIKNMRTFCEQHADVFSISDTKPHWVLMVKVPNPSATAKKLAAYVRDRGGTVALGDLEVWKRENPTLAKTIHKGGRSMKGFFDGCACAQKLLTVESFSGVVTKVSLKTANGAPTGAGDDDSARAAANRARVAASLALYLRVKGGSMQACDIHEYYREFPEHKQAIGKLRTFCEEQNGLLVFEMDSAGGKISLSGHTATSQSKPLPQAPDMILKSADNAALATQTALKAAKGALTSSSVDRARAAVHLALYLRGNGGSMLACDIHKYYAQFPEYKQAIGKLKTFCEEQSDLLVYEKDPRPGKISLPRHCTEGSWAKSLATACQVAAPRSKPPPLPEVTVDSADNAVCIAASLAIFVRSQGGSISGSNMSEYYTSHPSHKQVISETGLRVFAERYDGLFRFEPLPGSGTLSLRSHCCHYLRGECVHSTDHDGKLHSIPSSSPVLCAFGPNCKQGHWKLLEELAARSKRAGTSPTPSSTKLNVSEIRWTHDAIRATFRDGKLLMETLVDLLTGKLRPSDLPMVEVLELGASFYTIEGNRRLWIFKELQAITGEELTIEVRRKTDVKGFTQSFTSKNGGQSVEFYTKSRDRTYPSMSFALAVFFGRVRGELEMSIGREVAKAPTAMMNVEALAAAIALEVGPGLESQLRQRPDLFQLTKGEVSLADCMTSFGVLTAHAAPNDPPPADKHDEAEEKLQMPESELAAGPDQLDAEDDGCGGETAEGRRTRRGRRGGRRAAKAGEERRWDEILREILQAREGSVPLSELSETVKMSQETLLVLLKQSEQFHIASLESDSLVSLADCPAGTGFQQPQRMDISSDADDSTVEAASLEEELSHLLRAKGGSMPLAEMEWAEVCMTHFKNLQELASFLDPLLLRTSSQESRPRRFSVRWEGTQQVVEDMLPTFEAGPEAYDRMPAAMRNVQLAALASAFTAAASLSVPLHATFWGGPRLLVDVAPEAATGKQVASQRLLLDTGSSTLAFCEQGLLQQTLYEMTDYVSCNAYNPGGNYTGYWGPFVVGDLTAGNLSMHNSTYSVMANQVGMPCGDGVEGIFGIAFQQLDAGVPVESFSNWNDTASCPIKNETFLPPPLLHQLQASGGVEMLGIYWSGDIGEEQARLYIDEDAVNEHYDAESVVGPVAFGELGWFDVNIQRISVGDEEFVGFNCTGRAIGQCTMDTGTPTLFLPQAVVNHSSQLLEQGESANLTIWLEGASGEAVPVSFDLAALGNNSLEGNSQDSSDIILGMPLWAFYYTVFNITGHSVSLIPHPIEAAAAIPVAENFVAENDPSPGLEEPPVHV